ncbi:MAG: hypothetical protein K2X90_01565 [Candidatus Babeliaceae bacterium]|nr:hypothetical protein [Candidatus Babeliaceae bacterium]
MKQLTRIFLSLALLVPAIAYADSCNSSNDRCTNTACDDSCNASVSCSVNSCNTSCDQSSCFNSCATSVCNTSCENRCGCPTLLLKRPTYDNTAIYYGLDYQHQYDKNEFYGGFQVALEYQRSFNSNNLARGMFGGTVLNFAGSQVVNPADNALLADNFGLPVNFQGSVYLKPVISDFNMHFDWFLGFDKWAPGLYMQVDMNYDYQTRELQSECSCEFNYTTSTVQFPAGYMSAATSPVYPILDLQTALGLQGTFGDKKTASQFGRFDFCKRTKSGLAGLSVNLGYDFVRLEDYFLGAFFRVVAPTGSSVQPCYVFDAVVGNGKGWEVGAGISSRWEMWNNNDCQKLTAMLDGYVTSVLKHHSLRTFDLASTNTAVRRDYTCYNSCTTSCANSCEINSCNNSCTTSCAINSCDTGCSISNCDTTCSTGCSANNSCGQTCTGCNAQNCLTRYSLLKEFSLNEGAYTYANNLITAADFTTRNVEVRTPVKGDATIRLVYSHGGFDLGFGYNVFGMVREKISSVSAPSSCIFTTTNSVFGVKGCQCVAYNSYTASTLTGTIINTVPSSVPLQSTASLATAYASGVCASACVSADNTVDIPTYSTSIPTAAVVNTTNFNAACTSPIYAIATNVSALPAGYVQATNSSTPVVLDGTPNDLDLCSGTAPRQFTNKGFITLDYTWVDNDWTPYIGFIGEVEGGSRNTDIAQWGVVLRGGFSY